MAATPSFAAIPRLAVAQVTAANTNRDGTGTIVTVLTGASTGTRVRRIEVQAVGTTTAGMVRLFLHDGTNARLFLEVPVSAITPSGTVAAFMANFSENTNVDQLPLVLPSASWSIRAATHNAETFNIIVEGADL